MFFQEKIENDKKTTCAHLVGSWPPHAPSSGRPQISNAPKIAGERQHIAGTPELPVLRIGRSVRSHVPGCGFC